ncbi:Uncharacterised protein [Mycobacteroides abscessus subsp. abscessus]|nr:Uncharacterised protein [Mycobacteroides abscessus subsp. abscessus]
MTNFDGTAEKRSGPGVVLGSVGTAIALALLLWAVKDLLASGQAFCSSGQGDCGVVPWWTQIDRMEGVLLAALLVVGLATFTVRALVLLRRGRES